MEYYYFRYWFLFLLTPRIWTWQSCANLDDLIRPFLLKAKKHFRHQLQLSRVRHLGRLTNRTCLDQSRWNTKIDFKNLNSNLKSDPKSLHEMVFIFSLGRNSTEFIKNVADSEFLTNLTIESIELGLLRLSKVRLCYIQA